MTTAGVDGLSTDGLHEPPGSVESYKQETEHIAQIKHIAFSVPEKPVTHENPVATIQGKILHQDTTIIDNTNINSIQQGDGMAHSGIGGSAVADLDNDYHTIENGKLGEIGSNGGANAGMKGTEKSGDKQRMQKVAEARKLAEYYLNMYLQEQKATRLKTNWG